MTTAAMLAICLLALVAPPNTAEADDSNTKEAADPRQYNGKIAFTSNQDGYDAIYTVEPDGSNLSKLNNNSYIAGKPVWSPDGTEMAFGRQGIHSSDVSISIISGDGSDLRDPYTIGANYNPGSTWSPDGTKLAFSSFGVSQNGLKDIYMMDADGSNLVNVTKSPEFDEYDPDFSPNGSRICYSGYRSKQNLQSALGIYIMDSDGSDPKPLVEVANEYTSGEECDWSPDGTKIAFHAIIPDAEEERDRQKAIQQAIDEGNLEKAQDVAKVAKGTHDAEVYVINTDGGGRTALTNNAAADANLHWSSDGTKFTFASDRDGDFDIYTMDADGSDVVQVTNLPYDEVTPDWQPLPGSAPPKDADGPDAAQGTKKPGADDVDRDRPERTVKVKPGDSLWSISEQRLGPEASPQRVYDHTYQMYALNRKRIGSDLDLIFAGQRLSLPPLGEG